MTTRSSRSSGQAAAVTDLAALLARGYLRLTEKRHRSATSQANPERDKHLDLRAGESPDRVQERVQ